MNKITTIITRHPGLVQYLAEIGLTDAGAEVLAHATPDNVRGKHVCGVLPHSLSCLTASFTEVPLALPAELRGVELTLDQVRQYAGTPVTYRVTEIPGDTGKTEREGTMTEIILTKSPAEAAKIIRADRGTGICKAREVIAKCLGEDGWYRLPVSKETGDFYREHGFSPLH